MVHTRSTRPSLPAQAAAPSAPAAEQAAPLLQAPPPGNEVPIPALPNVQGPIAAQRQAPVHPVPEVPPQVVGAQEVGAQAQAGPLPNEPLPNQLNPLFSTPSGPVGLLSQVLNRNVLNGAGRFIDLPISHSPLTPMPLRRGGVLAELRALHTGPLIGATRFAGTPVKGTFVAGIRRDPTGLGMFTADGGSQEASSSTGNGQQSNSDFQRSAKRFISSADANSVQSSQNVPPYIGSLADFACITPMGLKSLDLSHGFVNASSHVYRPSKDLRIVNYQFQSTSLLFKWFDGPTTFRPDFGSFKIDENEIVTDHTLDCLGFIQILRASRRSGWNRSLLLFVCSTRACFQALQESVAGRDHNLQLCLLEVQRLLNVHDHKCVLIGHGDPLFNAAKASSNSASVNEIPFFTRDAGNTPRAGPSKLNSSKSSSNGEGSSSDPKGKGKATAEDQSTSTSRKRKARASAESVPGGSNENSSPA